MTAIAEQIAHIAKVANFWCNLSIICGVIGFVLSVACAVYLIKNYKEENNGER